MSFNNCIDFIRKKKLDTSDIIGKKCLKVFRIFT